MFKGSMSLQFNRIQLIFKMITATIFLQGTVLISSNVQLLLALFPGRSPTPLS